MPLQPAIHVPNGMGIGANHVSGTRTLGRAASALRLKRDFESRVEGATCWQLPLAI